MVRRAGTGAEGVPGRRSYAYTPQGASVRAVKGGHGLHVVGTVLAAANRGGRVVEDLIDFRPQDLRGQLRRGREANLIVFVVDSSGSMAGQDRLAAVTGAVHSMLRDAYQRRDRVAVITVRGADAEVVLPPTSSIDVAVRRLHGLPTGGRTPLGEGLLKAHELMEREHRREPGRRPILIVISDGRATGGSGLEGARQAAHTIAARRLAAPVVIDCEKPGRVQLGLARELAKQMNAVCLRLSELSADNVVGVIDAL
ncbi:VWA domain-containing protein [Corynebacterium hindlerae]|uniref:vWA domain-containing protein n=1 Tax=Corynebacterium hindlerae TaxID=699041 RepID=UPI001AD7556D|nr:VWA domain-containing protein [Corynebacterium hindlerae]QTH60797.1 VWA domain-containing protein [Corynebacterium hindlerae]